MSGLGGERKGCTCYVSHCLNGNCSCFKENLRCSEACRCGKRCENKKKNKARVESLYNAYLKRKSLFKKDNGCKCKEYGCVHLICSCFGRRRDCTAKCKCQHCTNRNKFGVSGASNTEQRQGSEDSVSNVPSKAVQTTPPTTTGAPATTNDHGTSCD